MGLFPTDPDGTFKIYWWVWVVIKFIPVPWNMVATAIVTIFDNLSPLHKAAIAAELNAAAIRGDHAKVVSVINDMVVGKMPTDTKGLG